MTGEESFGEFARTQTAALMERLAREVVHALAWGDADSVHDLRVTVRRFDQALRVFEEFFAPKEAKRIRKQMKELMKLTSRVRDLDIALEFLDERQKDTPVLEDLRAGPERERTDLAGQLMDALQRWRRADLPATWSGRLFVEMDEPRDIGPEPARL